MQAAVGSRKKGAMQEDGRIYTRSVLPFVPHFHTTGSGIRFGMDHSEEARVPIPGLGFHFDTEHTYVLMEFRDSLSPQHECCPDCL
jgi:hypothetical protein